MKTARWLSTNSVDHKPDLVFMDIGMPVMNVFQAARGLLEHDHSDAKDNRGDADDLTTG